MSRFANRAPRGIGLALVILTMLTGSGWLAVCWQYIFPTLKDQPNGLWIFLAIFGLGYLIISILILVVSKAAKRSFIQAGAFLPLVTTNQVVTNDEVVAVLKYWPVTVLLIGVIVLVGVLILRNVSDWKVWDKKVWVVMP